MSDYKIRVQKGIAFPPVRQRGLGGRRKPIYPWAEMEVGDSFLFPEHVGRTAYSSATNAGKTSGMKFRVRSTEGGMRCWRIR